MPEPSGLLQTWSRFHKKVKRNLRNLLPPGSGAPPDYDDLRLAVFYRQMAERAAWAASLLNTRFETKYDDRLPLVVRGNAALLRLTVSTVLDYVLDRHSGVGYTAFEARLTEDGAGDYASFIVWHTGVSAGTDDRVRLWFSQDGVERACARMGGHFRAKNQQGLEPRYTVSIPLAPGKPSKAGPPLPKPNGLERARLGSTALVVDDSRVSRVLGVNMLSRHDIAAEAAASGREALKMLTAKNYDLVFMDDGLPKMSGAETIAGIRSLTRAPAGIIGLVSDADSGGEGRAAFLAAGVEGQLAKPVDPLELNLLLGNLLPRLGLSAEAGAAPPAPRPVDAARENLLRALSGVSELDAERGLANAGDSVEIYVGLLRRFAAELTDYIEPLQTLAGEGLWEEVATRLSVLREFFAGLGAEDLALEAAVLAAAADAWGEEVSVLRIQRHCDAMMRLRAKLVGLSAGAAEAAGPHRPERPAAELVDMTTLGERVRFLHDACLSLRATEAQEEADRLRGLALPPALAGQVESIGALVDTLDYQDARERCLLLLEAL